jgi:hypothetical protein
VAVNPLVLPAVNRPFMEALGLDWSAAKLTVDVQVRCQDLEVTVPVARRLPLIACKLHAWLDRRDQRAEKRGSDGLDIVRLLGTADWDAFAADAREIDGLGKVLAWGANAGSSTKQRESADSSRCKPPRALPHPTRSNLSVDSWSTLLRA